MFAPYRPMTHLLLTAGEIRGRKKLQKMVFIAQSLGYPFPEPFDLHVWGPYSEVLAVKVQEMKDWGFACEEALPGPAGNLHFVYTPGPNAGRVLGEQEEGARAERLAGLVRFLNQQDATLLEGVATLLYLQARGGSVPEVGATLARLKPDKFADPARVEAAIAFVERLRAYRAA